jgi:hypothetical protein
MAECFVSAGRSHCRVPVPSRIFIHRCLFETMTIFQAKEYDPGIEKRRRIYGIAAIALVIVAGLLVYHFWDWREERVVNKFFTAIEHRDYERAYALWNDWGPTGEYGEIRSHHIRTAMTPKNSSGVVVVTMINDRKEPLPLWVEKNDHSITFLPPTLNIRIEP